VRRPRLGSLVVAALTIASASCVPSDPAEPICARPGDSILVLQAQSVPSATRLPCIAELPIGWRFGGSLVRDDGAVIWLDHDRAGMHAVEVELMASCDVSSAVEVPPALEPFAGTRSLVFDGGCIVYRYRFASGSEPSLVIEADSAVSTLPRVDVVAEVRETLDLTLCGAGAPPCEG
jgi:hypothetical protein